MIEPGKAYTGLIYDGKDLEKNNKYPVYIRQLSTPGQINIIWATNEVSGNTFSRWIDPLQHASQESSKMSAGSYFPLKRGMKVEVKFRTNDISDAYISKIINNDGYMPINHQVRDDFYLVCKTINDSYIYLDDNREIIHLMNSAGKSNILMDPNRVVLHVGELINGGIEGVKADSIVEVNSSGINLKFGNSFIKIDAGGVLLSAGEKSKSFFHVTESGFKFGGDEDITIKSEKNLNLIGQKTYVTGLEEINIHSTNTKMSGAQMMNITGNIISLDSSLETSIKGTHIGVDALMKLHLSGLMIDCKALSTLYCDSIMYTNNSQVMTNNTSVMVNNSSTIMNDGITLSNMQFAMSAAQNMYAVQESVSISTEAAMAALSMGMGFNDPISGSIANIMNSALPGSANPANNLLSLPTLVAPMLDGANTAVSYVNGFNNAGNNLVRPPMAMPL